MMEILSDVKDALDNMNAINQHSVPNACFVCKLKMKYN
jgi:hypothetical protein